MSLDAEPRTLRFGTREVSALWTKPSGTTTHGCFVYAPGAGSGLNDPFGAYLAERLAADGTSCLRFQFPYAESGQRRPDPPAVLEATWRAAIDASTKDGSVPVCGGRSMGGRYASMVASKGAALSGLALFAYPLHPPASPDQRRDAHLPRITVPTLFCSGTRDTFATPDELTEAAELVPGSTVHLLDGADHGFQTLKGSGRSREDVWREAVDALIAWWATLPQPL